jgi:hypothetical protein
MPAPQLSLRALNRTLLARQLLLKRSPIAPLDAVEHLVGLQAQNPPSPYLALRARLEAFDPLDLSRHLERRVTVRMVLMRGTIHFVSAPDAAGLREVMQPVLHRELYGNRTWARGLEGVDVAPILELGERLVEERPRSLAELRREIAARWPDLDAGTLAYSIRNLLPTIQVTPRGLWGRTGPVALTTLDHWTGRPMGEPFPLHDVVLRYLRAFGPAAVADVAAWSGLRGLREVLERLRPSLRTFRDPRGRELFDVPDGPILSGDEPADVRLLPDYDNALLSHEDRARIVPPLTWPTVRDNVTMPAYLVDGFVAGIWKPYGSGPRAVVELRPLVDHTPAERAALEAEASATLAFLEPRADPASVRWWRGDQPG